MRFFRRLAVIDNVALAVAERRGVARRMLRAAKHTADVRAESMDLLATLGLAEDAGIRIRDLPYGKQRLVENRESRSAESLAFCSSTTAGRRSLARVASHPAGARQSAKQHCHPDHRARHGSRFPLRAAHHRSGAARCWSRGRLRRFATDKRVHQVYLGEQHHG